MFSERRIRRLLKQLQSKDNVKQAQAAQALGKLPEPTEEVFEMLAATLRNPDLHVREVAANALDTLVWQPPTEALKAEHAIAQRRWEWATEIGVAAVGPLLEALRGERPLDYAQSVADALMKIKDKAAVEPLCEALQDADQKVAAAAARALGSLREASAIDPLLAVVKGNESGTAAKLEAITALGKLGAEQGRELIREQLEDTVLRPAAGAALAALGEEDEIWPLLQICRGHLPNEEVLAAGLFRNLAPVGEFTARTAQIVFGILFTVVFGVVFTLFGSIGWVGVVLGFVTGTLVGPEIAKKITGSDRGLPANVALAITPTRLYAFRWGLRDDGVEVEYPDLDAWYRDDLEVHLKTTLTGRILNIQIEGANKALSFLPQEAPESPGAFTKVIELLDASREPS